MSQTPSPVITEVLDRLLDFQSKSALLTQHRRPYVISDEALTAQNKKWADRTDLDRQLLRAERARESRWAVDGGLIKSSADRMFLQQVDLSLLTSLCEQGFFSEVPGVIQDDGGYNIAGCTMLKDYASYGRIVMVSDELGGTARLLSSVSVPGRQSALGRCFSLLHEAAHCEFGLLSAPFQPQDNLVPDPVIDAFNSWVFRRFINNREDHVAVLEESFCDCYSLMVLLKSTGFDQDTKDVASAICCVRKTRREDRERKISTRPSSYRLLDPMPSHGTDFAIEKMLAGIDSWKDLDPKSMKEKAKAYASDGFLDLIDPDRLSVRGRRVGEFFRAGVANPSLGEKTPRSLLTRCADLLFVVGFAGHEGNEHRTRQWINDHLSDHPLRPLAIQALDDLLPSCQSFFATKGPEYSDARERDHPGEQKDHGTQDLCDIVLAYRERPSTIAAFEEAARMERRAACVVADFLAMPRPEPLLEEDQEPSSALQDVPPRPRFR